MTGRGEGHCALVLPGSGRAPYGYAGLQGAPVRLGGPIARPAFGNDSTRGLPPMPGQGRALGRRRGRGRGAGRRRGRRVARW
jgi:hypothetical protein